MTFRFAAARPAALPNYVPRTRMVRIAALAANDNGDGAHHAAVLRAALGHFSALGLAAAADARDRARQAYFTGDRQGFRHWLAICRTLDRRMAVALASNLARQKRR